MSVDRTSRSVQQATDSGLPGFRAIAVGLLLLLAASFARAGELRKLDLATPLLIHGGAQALDHFSTRAALGRGGLEVGPVARHTGPDAARLIGGACFLGADVLAQKKGPRWAKWAVRAAAVGLATYAVRKNNKVGR